MTTHEQAPDPRARMLQLIVADLLGEASPAEQAEVQSALAADPELVRERERLQATIGLVRGLTSSAASETLSPAATARLDAAAAGAGRAPSGQVLPGPGAQRRPWHQSPVFRAAASVALALGAFALVKATRDSRLAPATVVGHLEAERPNGAATASGKSAPERERLARADDLAQGSASIAEGKDLRAGVDLEMDVALLDELRQLGYGGGGGSSAPRAESRSEEASVLLSAAPTELTAETSLEKRAKQRDQSEEARLGLLAAAGEPPASQPVSEGGAHKGPGDTVPPGGGGASRLFDAATASSSGPGTPGPAGPGAPVGGGPQAGAAVAGAGQGGSYGGRFGGRKNSTESRAYGGPASPGSSSSAPARTGADEFFLGRSAPDPYDGPFSNEATTAKYEVSDLEALRGLGYVGDDDDGVARRAVRLERQSFSALTPAERAASIDALLVGCRPRPNEAPRDMFYRWWGDNPFEDARRDHLSTFAVDVDTASYTLARRYLVDGKLPTKAQIRTEEFVNYFKGDVPAPSEDTFAVASELSPSLFNASPDTWMLRVALRGREVARAERKPLALTFVVDVSGSMKEQNRLELVKHALRLLVGELDANDSVALVAFSNEARLVLPMTSARNRGLIESAIHPLAPQGGTNVQAGLRMGYEAALVGLAPEAHNRVVFLSDGVGNIGATDAETINLEVERARKQGVWLNTIGVGMGNHNDAFLEQLADKGDGICNYVDDEREARRALVENFTGAFEPIAKDVKIQVEFDPGQVSSYRLLGYENRAVADRDFRNDAVDAGEIGSGHQVVALYEIVRTGNGDGDAPLATVRVRWKPILLMSQVSNQMVAGLGEAQPAREAAWTVRASAAAGSFAATSAGYRRSVLVAQLAEVLRRSIHARDDSLETLLVQSRQLAPALGDPDYDEFVHMVERGIELLAPEYQRYDTLARRLDELRRCNYEYAQTERATVQPDRQRLEQLEARARDLEADIRAELEREPDRFEKTKVR